MKADTFKTRPTLLSKVRHGDEEGWRRFYDLYETFIYAAGRGAGLSHEEARDLVQDSMVTVRDYIQNFVPDETRGQFRTWLRKVVQSRIADHYRKKQRNPLEKVASQPAPEDTSTATAHRIPNLNELDLSRLIDGKLEQAILAEAQKLTKDNVRIEDYQAYDLFDTHELPASEVAVSLGISPSTVRVRAFRVRKAVTREVKRIVRQLNQSGRASRVRTR